MGNNSFFLITKYQNDAQSDEKEEKAFQIKNKVGMEYALIKTKEIINEPRLVATTKQK